jgi:hypothetical protein
MIMDSALLFDTAPRQHKMPVKLGDPKRARRRALEVPISVAIPVDELVFLPSGDRFVADLELHLGLRDSDGRQSEEIEPIPFEIRVNGTPRPGTNVAYDTRCSCADNLTASSSRCATRWGERSLPALRNSSPEIYLHPVRS